jgi:hypothetical protein
MELEMDRAQRIFTGTVLPGGLLAVWLVPWLLFWGDLPDPMAIHFDTGGDPNGSMARVVFLVFTGLPVVVAGIVLARAVRHPTASAAPALAATATFVGALEAVISLDLVLANRGVADWHAVTFGLGATTGAIAAACAVTLPVVLLERRISGAAHAIGAAPVLPIGADDRAAWFGGCRSTGFAVAAIAHSAIGAVCLAVLGLAGVGVTLLATGAVLGLFASVQVSVSAAGVRVRSGPLHWPGVSFDLHEIERAASVEIKGIRWGWGYRGSLTLFRRAAWLLRTGPALELHLIGKGTFSVTIDDADEAAAVLNGLLARRAHVSQ